MKFSYKPYIVTGEVYSYSYVAYTENVDKNLKASQPAVIYQI